MTYAEKLRDPRWQKKRLEIFERDGWACQLCKRTNRTLHIHHRIYIDDMEPWEYGGDLLVTLCEECHSQSELTPHHIETYDPIRIIKSGMFWK